MEGDGALVKTRRWGGVLAGGMRQLGTALVDMLYPPCCVVCDAPMARADALCPACFAQLRPITAPLCPRLGIPFSASLGPEALSAEALADPPPFGRARAAVSYGPVARALVSRLKYGDRPELAGFCGRLMVGAGQALLTPGAVLVPVPLHASRQRERRFNQSAELARATAALSGLRVETGLVARTRRTRQQVGLSGDGRNRNVSGAFTPSPLVLERLGGRRVVLVDDVYTTGATVKAVTRALKRAGVAEVDVLTFARVVIGEEVAI